MRREELEARVDSLAREHDRDGFVGAVKRLSEELAAADRELLGEVLIGRANEQIGVGEALEEVRKRRWRLFSRVR